MELPELPEPAKKELRFHAGCDVYIPDDYESYFTPDQMRNYALEAIAAERERCAQVCETLNHGAFGNSSYLSGIQDGSVGCAAAIRAQGS